MIVYKRTIFLHFSLTWATVLGPFPTALTAAVTCAHSSSYLALPLGPRLWHIRIEWNLSAISSLITNTSLSENCLLLFLISFADAMLLVLTYAREFLITRYYGLFYLTVQIRFDVQFDLSIKIKS